MIHIYSKAEDLKGFYQSRIHHSYQWISSEIELMILIHRFEIILI